MPTPSKSANLLRVSELSHHKPTLFALRPDLEASKAIAESLGLRGLRKVSLNGTVQAAGKTDWTLEARLGATVGQPCVVTLETVTTRIETTVTRHFLARMPSIETNAELGEEIELPQDDNIEPLEAEIDLDAVLLEALALALPDYPRSPDAALETAVFTEPGKKPMQNEDARPFAALSGLRDSLESGAEANGAATNAANGKKDGGT